MNKAILTSFAVAALCAGANALTLPAPAKEGGKPLLTALAERKSCRDYQVHELDPQTLSSLLWAADGVSRPDGRRTAPTGLNVQDIDIYVMLASGVYLYDAKAHALVLVNEGDHRAAAGRQPFPKTVPLNLFYVQDLSKAMRADEANTARHGGIHTGAIMQNVYLFCAQEKLGCVARDYIDRAALAPVLKLRADQRIILGQSVGYMK